MPAIDDAKESFWCKRKIYAYPLFAQVPTKKAAFSWTWRFAGERLVQPQANYRRVSLADVSAESRIGGNYLKVAGGPFFQGIATGVVQCCCDERR